MKTQQAKKFLIIALVGLNANSQIKSKPGRWLHVNMKSLWLLAVCVESLFVRVPGKREDSNLDFYLGFQKDPQASRRPLDYFGLLPFILMSPESDLNC